jgi:hypothetical protein
MGYAHAVPLKSQKAKKEMLLFLKKSFRPWNEVAVGTDLEYSKDYDPTWIICDGAISANSDITEGRLSVGERGMFYDSGRSKIGIEYTATDFAVSYWTSVCRWIALVSGRKRKFNDFGGIVPYTVYDGFEAWPVLRSSEWAHKVSDKWKWTLVDDVGFKIHRDWVIIDKAYAMMEKKHYFDDMKNRLEMWDDLVKKELYYLDGEWKKCLEGAREGP